MLLVFSTKNKEGIRCLATTLVYQHFSLCVYLYECILHVDAASTRLTFSWCNSYLVQSQHIHFCCTQTV